MRKRKYALVAIVALLGSLTLAACNKQGADHTQTKKTTVAQIPKPTNPNDQAAWGKYLGQVLSQHLQGMTASRPYPYLVPAGTSTTAKGQRARQLDTVTGVVLRGVTPGNLLAFGGPSSKDTADLIVSAFKQAPPGSMKGVIVLFIGDKSDNARVKAAVKPTDATYRFVQM